MNERDKMQQQMAEIGARFIKRTLGELDQLRELLERARTGSAESVKEIERVSHKIAGSGAMFGFDAVSERAQELEIFAEGSPNEPVSLQRLSEHIAALDAEVRSAARARGVE